MINIISFMITLKSNKFSLLFAELSSALSTTFLTENILKKVNMGNNDDEAGTSDTSKVSQKKARGENIDKVYHHPPSGESFTMKWSFDHQPIGKTGALFNKKIGILARRNELFPIDKKWVEQSKDKLAFAISELQEEYDLHENPMAHDYINGKLGKIWQDNYNKFLKKFTIPELTEDEIIKNLPHSVNSTQFLNQMKMHFSEKGMEISKLNKINRAKQMTQHVGTKGLASRSHELMEQGMSQGESWMSTMGTCYPQEEKIANTINFV